jgi:hypothetical protein
MVAVILYSAALWGGQAGPDKPALEVPVAGPVPDKPALERPTAASAPAPTAAPDRWLLMKALQGTWEGDLLDGSRIGVSGWTDLGVTFGTAPSNNLPLGFNYRDNTFSLQQNWLRVERAVVTTGTTEPSFGFRCDTFFGTDYRFTVAKGLLDQQLTANNGMPNTYGVDPVQFYAEAYFPTIGRGLDVKVGRVYAPYGLRSIEAPGNLLFSNTYTFLDNPFTQTGAFATLQLTPEWVVESGFALGQDVFFDGGDLNYVGNVKWARPDGRDSAVLSVLLCSGRFNQARRLANANIIDLVIIHKINSRLTYRLESLGGYQTNNPGLGTDNWLGIVNYLTYDFTARTSGTVRLEFWDDPKGVRTGGKPGLYTVLTTGVNFHPRKDLVFRPEVRYDYNDETRAFQGRHALFTAAVDVILRW